jgi:hypothetical protein
VQRAVCFFGAGETRHGEGSATINASGRGAVDGL